MRGFARSTPDERSSRHGQAPVPDRRHRCHRRRRRGLRGRSFLASWKPSARAKALGAPVEVDISKVEPGAMIKVEWRGKAVFVVHRTPQMLTQLEGMAPQLRDPDSKQSEQPDFARNPARALKPEYLVLVGVCTHLGCAPLDRFTPGDVTVARRLAGRFLLSLPWLQVRPFRPGLQGRPGADQPVRPALPIPERQPAPDRGRNGERMMSTSAGNRAPERRRGWRRSRRGSTTASR